MLVITLVGIVSAARVAVVLRQRDRDDHETLREDFNSLEKKVGELGERVARLEGSRR
jgi:recombinational DNA repair protein RecR